jgi:hypothetical protein
MSRKRTSHLNVSNLILLPLVALHLVLVQFSSGLDVRVVVARKVVQLVVAQQDDVGAHSVEKVLRVRRQQQNSRIVGKVLRAIH